MMFHWEAGYAFYVEFYADNFFWFLFPYIFLFITLDYTEPFSGSISFLPYPKVSTETSLSDFSI